MAIANITSVVVIISSISVIEVSMRCRVCIMLVMVVISRVMSLVTVVSIIAIIADTVSIWVHICMITTVNAIVGLGSVATITTGVITSIISLLNMSYGTMLAYITLSTYTVTPFVQN